jgi:type II secretory pathway pseudopilin PulG
MKTNCDNSKGKTGFTIIELLTVMSIIIVLISLLVPALNRVRRYAQLVKQNAQFHAISIALDLFNAEEQGYPPSEALDPTGVAYCGAMKLAEAMVGQDLSGFHPDSQFRRNGTIPNPPNPDIDLYPPNPGFGSPTYQDYVNNIRARKSYLQLENANAYRLTEIYTPAHLAGTDYDGLGVNDSNLVLCDVYVRTMATGNKTGMPILYYRADTSKTEHDYANRIQSTYNSDDNQELVDIPLPWVTSAPLPAHPMTSLGGTTQLGAPTDPAVFYNETQDKKVTTSPRPYRADSYILMSAGFDNEYGTSDDVFNFGK